MKLLLQRNDTTSTLEGHYKEAFATATELYMVSAYLTSWDAGFQLTEACEQFRLIVGKDFGITRKQACKDVLRWLPSDRKADFLVADGISTFHPKAAFWRAADGKAYMLMGSSNLTRAAFKDNVEANVVSEISELDYQSAKEWIEWIAERSIPVSEDWLERYVEASVPQKASGSARDPAPVITFALPSIDRKQANGLIHDRRTQLDEYAKRRPGMERLLKKVAAGKITNLEFFDQLSEQWDVKVGNRLQGAGWERQGKQADFSDLAQTYWRIVEAPAQQRDDVVVRELDRLHKAGNRARKSFLSEMLCLRFPTLYPLLNKPVWQFIADNNIRSPKGASEGARYIDLARKLRAALTQAPTKYPAKTVAELDTLIWAASDQAA